MYRLQVIRNVITSVHIGFYLQKYFFPIFIIWDIWKFLDMVKINVF